MKFCTAIVILITLPRRRTVPVQVQSVWAWTFTLTALWITALFIQTRRQLWPCRLLWAILLYCRQIRGMGQWCNLQQSHPTQSWLHNHHRWKFCRSKPKGSTAKTPYWPPASAAMSLLANWRTTSTESVVRIIPLKVWPDSCLLAKPILMLWRVLLGSVRSPRGNWRRRNRQQGWTVWLTSAADWRWPCPITLSPSQWAQMTSTQPSMALTTSSSRVSSNSSFLTGSASPTRIKPWTTFRMHCKNSRRSSSHKLLPLTVQEISKPHVAGWNPN